MSISSCQTRSTSAGSPIRARCTKATLGFERALRIAEEIMSICADYLVVDAVLRGFGIQNNGLQENSLRNKTGN
jgi:hypothetical protein